MKQVALTIGAFLFSTSLYAQTWHAGGLVGKVLALPGGCASTWYDPDVFVYPDGSRGFLAQGGMANTCTNNIPLDSLFRAKHDLNFPNPVTGDWIIPGDPCPIPGNCPPNLGRCPTLIGTYRNTDCLPEQDFDGFQPLASPAIAKVGSKYFMSFSGGNQDFRKGHIFWATSNDGINWTTWKWDPKPAGFAWRPLIYPKGLPNDPDDLCAKYGIPQHTLTYDPSTTYGSEGAFYIHFNYAHRFGELDSYTFRFKYSSANGFGLGGGMQVLLNNGPRGSIGTWVNHSGVMVFDYDGQPPQPGDPVLTRYGGNVRNFDHGSGSIVWDPSRSQWLRVYGIFDRLLHWQTSTSLASGVWTAEQVVDMSQFNTQVKARHPAYDGEYSYGGLWWGRIGTRTGMWMFVPADYTDCDDSNGFLGLGIFTVALNYF